MKSIKMFNNHAEFTEFAINLTYIYRSNSDDLAALTASA